jgi:ABC-2 type transport system ATP-binding protein
VLRVRLAAPADRARAQQVLAQALGVAVRAESDPAALTAQLEGDGAAQDASQAAARAISQLAHEGIQATAFAVGQPSLDEVFLALTGHAAQPASSEEEAA